MTITPTTVELIYASQEIGGICESAAWYTDLLEKRIKASGKSVGDHTVTELINLDRELREQINKASKSAQALLGLTKY